MHRDPYMVVTSLRCGDGNKTILTIFPYQSSCEYRLCIREYHAHNASILILIIPWDQVEIPGNDI